MTDNTVTTTAARRRPSASQRAIAMLDPAEFVTVKGAMELLGCGLQTIYRAFRRGDLRRFRLGTNGFYVVIPRADVEAFRSRYQAPVQQPQPEAEK